MGKTDPFLSDQFLSMVQTDQAATKHFKQIKFEMPLKQMMLEMPLGPKTDQTRDDPLYNASQTEFQKYWAEQESREFSPAKGLEDRMNLPEEAAEATGVSSLASLLSKGVTAEMPMLGALLGSGSVGGMVGGAAGAALGGVPGAIVGSKIGEFASEGLGHGPPPGVQSDPGGGQTMLADQPIKQTGYGGEPDMVKFLRSIERNIGSIATDGIRLREGGGFNRNRV